MKKKLLVIVFSIIAVFSLVLGVAACKNDNPSGSKDDPQQLSTPVVSISEDGLASWTAIDNASGYAYKLDAGEATNTDSTSVQLADGQSITVKAVGDGTNYTDSAWSAAKTYNAQSSAQKLNTPVVTIDGEGVASWTADSNAVGYIVKIDGVDGELTTDTSVTLTEGQKIQVKAVGDGTNYKDSEWSVEKTYGTSSTGIMTHAQYLAAAKGATVKVQGVVTGIGQDRVYFQDSDGGYLIYGINNLPAEVAVGKTIVAEGVLDIYNGLYEITNATVTVGDTATVTPIDITDIFTAATGMTDATLVNMQSAFITLKGVTLKVSEGNLYVVIGNNEAQLFVGSGKSHVLDADALAAIKAAVEANEGATADVNGYVTLYQGAFQIIPAEDALDIKGAQTLGTPVVSIDNDGVATWGADPNAVGYVVEVDGTAQPQQTATTYTLTNGQAIRVKAVGDGTNYKDSEWSAEKTYNQIVSKPSVKAATISFATDAAYKSHDANSQVWQANGITFTNEKGSSTTDVAKYAPVRCYKSSNVKVEYTAMIKIVFTCDDYNNGQYYLQLASTSDYIVTTDGGVVTVEFGAPVNQFIIEKLENQVRFTSIDVYVEKVAQNLSAPEVTIDLDGLATWEPVTGATGYEYVITHSDSTTTTDTITATQVQLANGDKIKVKSLGDGEDYISSDYGTEATYTMVPVTLGVPVVEVNHAGVASWDAVENAVKYVYVINDGEEQETTHRTVQLTNGQSIKVKAVGKEGSRFQASAYCEPVTYTAPTVAEQLENPTVTVAIDGTVTIENENAVSFDYTIGDGEKQNVANGEDGAAVTLATKLTNGQTIKVVAKGDGTYYTDSAEVEITYTAPQALEAVTEVTIAIEGNTANTVVITWTAVANATGYSYQIGSAAAVTTTDTTLTVILNEGTVFSVTALGDTATAQTATDGNYSAYYADSTAYAAPAFNIDNEKTYTVAEMVKIAIYYGETASTKDYTVQGVVSTNKAYDTGYKNIEITLKEGELSFGLYRNSFANDLLTDWGTTKIDELVHYTVTATGKPVNYKGNTPQFGAGGTVTAIEMKLNAEDRVAYAKVAMDDKLDCETTDADFTYTLPLTGKYGTTITWSFEGLEEDDYLYDDEEGTLVVTRKATDVNFTATATISYTNGDDTATDTLSFELTVLATGEEIPAITEVYFNFVDAYDNAVSVTSESKDGVTLTFGKGTNTSNDPKYYSIGTAIRFYGGNTLTIAADQNIKNIEFTVAQDTLLIATPDSGNYSGGTWTGGANQVVFSVTSNSRVSTIKVYLGEPSDEDKVNAALSALPDIAGEHNEDFEVVTSSNGLDITWSVSIVSGDGNIAISGTTATVTRGETNDTEVTVTASVTSGEVTKTRAFTVTIKQKPAEGTKEEKVLATLDFAKMSSIADKGNSSYTDTWTATTDNGLKWNIDSFNNNGKAWTLIKAGSKNNATTPSISVTIAGTVTSIEVTLGNVTLASSDTANLVVLNGSNQVTSIDIKAKFVKGTWTVDIPEEFQGEGYTYKLALSLAKTSSNGTVELSKIVCNGYDPA
ncbi:MAG: hypothetical protein J1G07_02800 [Clostridiales bacterium]|nr:hypothetical protein [Clostridiales bacterium]